MDINKACYREGKIALKRHESHVFKLSRTQYGFKQVDKREWEVMSTAAVLDHVSSSGFKYILSIKKNGAFKPYVKRGDEIYILMSQVAGQKLKLKNEANGLIFAELLAKFHSAAEGFVQPPGIKIRVEWGKRMERFRMLTSQLEKYINYIKNKETLSEFEEYTSQYTDLLIKRAKAAMKILKSLSYLRALENSMKRKEICINCISNNTAVIKGNNAVISKIFEVGYNMTEEDIADLIKKLIIETGDTGVFDKILSKYSSIREIGEDSENIIKALVSYPFDSVKVILKYYNHTRDMIEEDASYNACILKKFKKYLGRELSTDVLGGKKDGI